MSEESDALLHIADDHPCCKPTLLWAHNRLLELERENTALRKALADADIVAEYEGEDGRRDWWGSGHWLHTGEVLVCMDRAALDAARKEAQP